MQVMAFSSPTHPEWRWRIVNYAGETIEESRDVFTTITAAVSQGTRRLVEMNVIDRSVAASRGWTPARRRSQGVRSQPGQP
jgi:hypothetical protein